LVLIGGISAVAATGCGPSGNRPPSLSGDNVYTKNFYVAGVGYYHAPFRAWYSLPYNHFDPQNQRYFYGGQWSATACQSITNISAPSPQVAQQAEAVRTGIVRGGFGRTSGSHWIAS
jgi:hypothetical protein